jgi:hypothetical protein
MSNAFCISPALAALNVADPDLRMERASVLGELLESGDVIAVYHGDCFCGFWDTTPRLPMMELGLS